MPALAKAAVAIPSAIAHLQTHRLQHKTYPQKPTAILCSIRNRNGSERIIITAFTEKPQSYTEKTL